MVITKNINRRFGLIIIRTDKFKNKINITDHIRTLIVI